MFPEKPTRTRLNLAFCIAKRRWFFKKRINMMKNKRGWIKIVEAFIAILLLTGIVLFVINRQSDDVQQVYSLIQDAQTSILRNAQLNNTVRTEILSTNGQVDWGSFSTQAPNTMAEIQSNTPNYLSYRVWSLR